MSNRLKGIVAIVLSALGFAVMAACVRLCDDYGDRISCFEKGFFRNLIALGIAAVAFARRPREPLTPLRGRDKWLLLLRSVLGTVGIFANFYALGRIPIADGQTLNKTAPFFTVIFAWLFLGERTRYRNLAAVGLGLAGAALVAKPGFAGADSLPLLMGLLGGVCAGGAYAAVRALGAAGVSPALVVVVFSAFSCLAAVMPMTWDFVMPTWRQLFTLMGAGAGAALGQFGITYAYRYARPGEIAVFDYSNLVFTALLGYWLFGQVSDGWSLLGMAVIFIAAAFAGRD